MLARCLEQPQGMALVGQLGEGPQLAPALAFMATSARDHGAVGPAVQLLRRALAASPAHHGAALLLVHTLELTQDLSAGLQVGRCKTWLLPWLRSLGRGAGCLQAAAAVQFMARLCVLLVLVLMLMVLMLCRWPSTIAERQMCSWGLGCSYSRWCSC